MKKDEEPKAYARAQVKEVMTFRQFVDHIAEHGGHKRGQVKGVLSDMCGCLVEQLLEGKKILLDELGDFWISLTSIGAENCEAFTSKNITGVNIVFTPGVDFQNLINNAEFNLVASRIAQAATLKAEKKMLDTVDLAAAKNKGNGSHHLHFSAPPVSVTPHCFAVASHKSLAYFSDIPFSVTGR